LACAEVCHHQIGLSRSLAGATGVSRGPIEVDANPQPGASGSPQSIGQYEILRSIGRGGMGQVFLAKDTRLDRMVAVKAINPERLEDAEARARFVREAEVASSLVHPYVATVFDVLQKDDHTYLVMEHIEGRRLRDAIKDDDLVLDERLRVGGEIAEALSAIHDHGLIHRDLKPSNVMLTEGGHVKVLDFGLARRSEPVVPAEPSDEDETISAPLTRPGAAVGTVAYMSPEQLSGAVLDERSDIFSLGTVLYELTTGMHPFARDTDASTASAILNELPGSDSAPDSLTGSPDLRRVLEQALEKRPEDRYQRAAELVEDLSRLRRGESVAAGTARRARRRRRVLAWSLAPVAVIAALVVWGLWFLNRPPVWDHPRLTVSIRPFEDLTGTAEGAQQAIMLADLIAHDLESSRLVRVVGPIREPVMLGTFAPETPRPASYVFRGTLYREGSTYVATLKAMPRSGGASLPSLRADGDSPLMLAEELASALRRTLPEVSLITALQDDREDLASITSSSDEARRLYDRGLAAASDGKLSEAIQRLERAVEEDSSFAIAHAALAEVLHDAGYGRRARESAERAMTLAPSPESPGRERLALTIRVIRDRVFGDSDEAVESAAQLAKLYPDEPGVLKQYAAALTAASRFELAADALDGAIAMDPGEASLHLSRGYVLSLSGKPLEAEAAFAEARRLYEDVGSREGIALVSLREGFADLTSGAFERGLERSKEAAIAFDELGHDVLAAQARISAASLHINEQQFSEANKYYDEAIAIARRAGDLGTISEALTVRAAQLFGAGDLEGAEAGFREAIDVGRRIENDELLVDPLLMLGSVLIESGRLDEAEATLRDSISASHEVGREDRVDSSELLLAAIEYQRGKVEASIEMYQRVLERQKEDKPGLNSAWSAFGLAEIHERRGHLARALESADRAVRDFVLAGFPGYHGSALARRSQVLVALGRMEGAETDLEAARKQVGDAAGFEDLRVRLALAEALMYASRREWERSGEVAEEALAIPAASTPTHLVSLNVALCVSKREQRRMDEAITHCRAALAVERAAPVEVALARTALAEALRSAGREEESSRAAILALSEAEQLAIPLARARAAAVLLRVRSELRSVGEDELRRRGREGLEAYVAAAPEADREALRNLSELARLAKELAARGEGS